MTSITKKILVTGGAGFVGYNIARMLSEEAGNHIFIMDDLSGAAMDEDFRALIGKDNVTFYNLDMTDPASYEKIEPRYDHVYHLAGVDGAWRAADSPDLTVRVNALSTIYLLEFIRKAGNRPRLLFSSSSENYAGSLRHCSVTVPTPENVPLCIDDIADPGQAYAASKVMGEIACYHYARQCGFGCVIVRYHDLYGPRMGPQHVIPELVGQMRSGAGRLDVYGVHERRSFCYVTDAARMTIRLMSKEKAIGRAFNIGCDEEPVRVADVVRMLSVITGIVPEVVPHRALADRAVPQMPDMTAAQELGAYVSEVPFHVGLLNTYRWFDRQGTLKDALAPVMAAASIAHVR